MLHTELMGFLVGSSDTLLAEGLALELLTKSSLCENSTVFCCCCFAIFSLLVNSISLHPLNLPSIAYNSEEGKPQGLKLVSHISRCHQWIRMHPSCYSSQCRGWRGGGGWNQFSSVQFSCSVMSESLPLPGLQHTRLPCPTPTPRAYSNSCPLSWWCYPTISSSAIPFSSRFQSFPALGFFQMSQFFASEGQNIAGSASDSVLTMRIQDWFPLGWAGWISLQSKGLSRVFSNTTVQKHQFFSAQLSL